MNKPAMIPRLLFLIGTIHWFLFASAHSMIADIDFVLGMNHWRRGAFVLILAALILIIIDFDRSFEGLIQVNQ